MLQRSEHELQARQEAILRLQAERHGLHERITSLQLHFDHTVKDIEGQKKGRKHMSGLSVKLLAVRMLEETF